MCAVIQTITKEKRRPYWFFRQQKMLPRTFSTWNKTPQSLW